MNQAVLEGTSTPPPLASGEAILLGKAQRRRTAGAGSPGRTTTSAQQAIGQR
jgi:hypothetical protein